MSRTYTVPCYDENVMNYCSNCGHELTPGSNFCTKCGQEVDRSKQTQGQDGQSQPHSTPDFRYDDDKPHSRVSATTPDNGNFETDATVEFGDLHPNAVWLFFLSYMGHSAILIPLIVVGAFFEPMLWALLGVYLITHFLAAKVTYRNYRFEVTPSGFNKEYGIVHKQSSDIPFEQIQNVNISRTLLDRALGLAHVEIETAGTSGEAERNLLGGAKSASEGYIPGVSYDEACDLKELILLRTGQINKS